jgi:hypothetical protein
MEVSQIWGNVENSSRPLLQKSTDMNESVKDL